MNSNKPQNQQSCQTSVSGSTLISECDLSIRTKKLFINAGLNTVDDIFKHKICDLMKYKGFGVRSLTELRKFLARHNLSIYNG